MWLFIRKNSCICYGLRCQNVCWCKGRKHGVACGIQKSSAAVATVQSSNVTKLEPILFASLCLNVIHAKIHCFPDQELWFRQNVKGLRYVCMHCTFGSSVSGRDRDAWWRGEESETQEAWKLKAYEWLTTPWDSKGHTDVQVPIQKLTACCSNWSLTQKFIYHHLSLDKTSYLHFSQAGFYLFCIWWWINELTSQNMELKIQLNLTFHSQEIINRERKSERTQQQPAQELFSP